jgi:hypothetical protein
MGEASFKRLTEGLQAVYPINNVVYKDPAHEDWIECYIYKEWCQNACSGYEGVDLLKCGYS